MIMGPGQERQRIERPVAARAQCVAFAAMAYWFYEWDWGEAIAFDGIDAAAAMLGDAYLRQYVDAAVMRWLRSGRGNRQGPVGRAVARLRSQLPRWASLKPALDRLCEDMASAPQSDGGAFLLDSPGKVIFVDSLYSDPTSLAAHASTIGDSTLRDRAIDLCLGHARLLQDARTGLFRHYYDVGTGDSPDIHWGRGNGWALLGMSDLLGHTLGASLDGREEVVERFRLACEGLAAHEVPGGGWRNLVDDPASSPETSTTGMLISALLIGIRVGALEEAQFLPMAERAWRSIEHRIDANGHVMGVSFRPGLNRDAARYEHVPFAGSLPWGQGAYLRALTEWTSFHESRRRPVPPTGLP